jgi:hypothetical protein
MRPRTSQIVKLHKRSWLFFFLPAVLLAILVLILLDLPIASLLTFHQVDDFPLYIMQYRGDYNLLSSVDLQQIPGRAIDDEPGSNFACTMFYGRDTTDGALLGRNFDWNHKATLALFTHPQDGYASVSMVDLGYLGFDQGLSLKALRNLKQSPLWPFDGMNEQGVAIGIMAVPNTPGLHDPSKPTVDSLAVIRLVLDYAGNLDEALAILQGVNIDFEGGPWLHYLVSDRQGSAVVEILSDRVNVIRSQQPWQVSTNFILSGLSEAEADASCWRYRTASNRLEQNQGSMNAVDAMELLKDVSQQNTVWSVVYHLGPGEIQIALGRDYNHIHNFELANPAQEIK